MKSRQVSSLHSSKLFFFVLSILLVFLGWKFISLTSRTIESQSKIATLHSELQQMQSRQENLKRMEIFFKSDFFAEREARMKFGLQKKGEHMVILKNELESRSGNEIVTQLDEDATDDIQANAIHSSPRSQWWGYFFGN